MWDAIEANKRRSVVILMLMLLILLGMGMAMGVYIDPERGPIVGPLAALGLWLFLSLLAYFQGDSILLSTAGAREIQKSDAPQVWNLVEEMTLAAGLPVMPRVFIIYDDAPNAFATGRKPEKSAVAVTTGLLQRLDRDELQGVIAHEIGHVRNLDVRYMTIAAVMLGSIVMLSDVMLRTARFGGMSRGGRDRRGNQAQAIAMLVALVMAILAPLLARALYFACSRRREYLADASAALFTRYPEGLARALEKIALRPVAPRQFNRAVAPLYIVNPMQAFGATGLFSTHPSTEDRIRILRSMAGGADLGSYDAAFREAHGGEKALFKQGLLEEQLKLRIPARAAAPQAPKADDRIQRAAEALDTIDRMVGYSVLQCECGMRIKTPPGFPEGVIHCPRCGREHRGRSVPKPPPVAPVKWGK